LDHGEDSDFIRVRVRGVFPRAASLTFIASERLEAAVRCPLVDFAGRADRRDLGDAGARYANKRAEMWGLLKEWCRAGGCLPDDPALLAELGAVEYGYDAADAILLERKDDMRRRGLASPEDADALALTFAHPVFMPDPGEERRYEEGLRRLRRSIV
jgi:hypothetical protein